MEYVSALPNTHGLNMGNYWFPGRILEKLLPKEGGKRSNRNKMKDDQLKWELQDSETSL